MSDAIRKVVGIATILVGLVAAFSVITFHIGYSSQKNTLFEVAQSIVFVLIPFIAAWLLLGTKSSHIKVSVGYLLAAAYFVLLILYM